MGDAGGPKHEGRHAEGQKDGPVARGIESLSPYGHTVHFRAIKMGDGRMKDSGFLMAIGGGRVGVEAGGHGSRLPALIRSF